MQYVGGANPLEYTDAVIGKQYMFITIYNGTYSSDLTITGGDLVTSATGIGDARAYTHIFIIEATSTTISITTTATTNKCLIAFE